MLTTFNEVDMSPIMESAASTRINLRRNTVWAWLYVVFHQSGLRGTERMACRWRTYRRRRSGLQQFCRYFHRRICPKGLVVPVIRNAESMSLAEIEKAVAAFAVKARDNKFTLEEMTGGTFTITNGGVFGSMMSTPIINSPQSAILGMHNIIERPVAVNGQVVIRPMMYVACPTITASSTAANR